MQVPQRAAVRYHSRSPRRGSSVRQSNALVMRRSWVRIPSPAPTKPLPGMGSWQGLVSWSGRSVTLPDMRSPRCLPANGVGPPNREPHEAQGQPPRRTHLDPGPDGTRSYLYRIRDGHRRRRRTPAPRTNVAGIGPNGDPSGGTTPRSPQWRCRSPTWGSPGVRSAKVLINGLGVVGEHAIEMTVGLGANVTFLDHNITVLDCLSRRFGNTLEALHATTPTRLLRSSRPPATDPSPPGKRASPPHGDALIVRRCAYVYAAAASTQAINSSGSSMPSRMDLSRISSRLAPGSRVPG